MKILIVNAAAYKATDDFFVLLGAGAGMNKTPKGDVYYQQRLRL